MTDEERERVGALINRYGPETFMKVYMKGNPRQADRIQTVMDKYGSARAVSLLFNVTTPRNPEARQPGAATSTPVAPGLNVGVGATVARPGAPAQGIGATPSERTALGSGVTAHGDFGIGSTERLARDTLSSPGEQPTAAPIAGGIPAELQRQPQQEAPGPIQLPGREQPSRQSGLIADEIEPFTGLNSIPAVEPPFDSTADLYAFFDRVSGVSKETGVPLKLVMAMMKQESRFDPEAKSPVGARGLLQLMQSTAIDRGLKVDETVDERLNPMENIEAGLRHMAWIKQNFKPKNVQSWLAAYNAGHTRLAADKWKKMKEPRQYADNITKFVKEYEEDPSLLARDFIELHTNIRKGKGL